ncbi:hypothetical protein G8764_01530 [Pseudomaricurvus alcaniphilus]|uniref:hypothetical protein n=1 Tax=Pseudomaricurvus alcaniphilus TaxID=1166482 RepID=UPI00140B7B9F|nr:hypothetical protein [Pseudomaricurvus alcaniphilus]NHN35972.1 hypothetical protein [Pseudomaricurvus alcaniphilus]
MSTLNSLILLCLLACASLLAVSLVNKRERKRRQQQTEISSMKLRVQRLEELLSEIEPLLEKREIARLLNDEILDLVTQMRAMAPNNAYMDAIFQSALVRADTLADETVPTGLDRLKESDAQIARAHRSLEETALVIRRLRASDKITPAQMKDFLSQLSWAYLMVDSISQVGQGHKSVRRNNLFTAKAFYKKAQSLLLHSNHSDTRRHQFIRELSDLIAGKRSSISTQLMPESHLNPPD